MFAALFGCQFDIWAYAALLALFSYTLVRPKRMLAKAVSRIRATARAQFLSPCLEAISYSPGFNRSQIASLPAGRTEF
ncbi:hypothetical protein AUC71_09590 [Methyloceanibacter marginalis]|uniref:Uncharacterized protein n=1 Tax=Methyloceanibacter marginalis TaxID=1774971 RepID=A0A1E3WCE6_9HYPH|nr:hypothetical protein [Methyloceanibacter marginalis]ODS03456.1 hypothetical protein AUC71_09590 [Methyloceanibacter marginalis]